eukprot:344080_1
MFQETNCPIVLTGALIFYAIMCIIFILIAIYSLYIFITKEKEQTDQMNKKILCFETAFLIATILAIGMNVPLAFAQCFSKNYKLIFAMFWMSFWGIQSFLLLVVFFYRLLTVFKKTRFRLKKATEFIYKMTFIALPTYFVTIVIIVFPLGIWITTPFLAAMLVAIFLLAFIALSISLVILFIYKLIEVFKGSQSDPALISAVTKLSLLNTLSISITFLDGIVTVAFFSVSNESRHFEWIDIVSDYMTALDTFTNFCCIVLCYKSFKFYYGKLCQPADAKCRICVNYCCLENEGKKQKALKNHVIDHELTVEKISKEKQHSLCTTDSKYTTSSIDTEIP